MISYKIEYTVKRSEKNRVTGLIIEFIDGIRNNEPETIIYHAYQSSKNSVDFMHIMTFKSQKAENAHKESSYFQKFMEEIVPLCQKEPEFIPINLIR